MKFPWKSLVTLSLVSLGIAIVTEQKIVAEKERIQAESFSTSAIQEFFDAVQLEFHAFEADAEKGPDLGLSLVLRSGGDSGTGQAGSSDQSSLRDYCAGKTASSAPKVEAGAKVMADWEDYGSMYPGRIDKVHRNGTSRIHYDDGFTEDRVTPGNVKVVEERENKQNIKKMEKICDQPISQPGTSGVGGQSIIDWYAKDIFWTFDSGSGKPDQGTAGKALES
jgi:hypothetical protein